MPKFTCQRHGQTLVPTSKAAARELEKIKPGSLIMVDAKTPRNMKFHRLYWAMCAYLAEALNCGPTGLDWTQEMVSDRLKLATGRAEVFDVPKSLRVTYGTDKAVKPASISFAKMDETEFSAFVEQGVAYVLTEFGPWLRDHPDWKHVQEIVLHAQGRDAA